MKKGGNTQCDRILKHMKTHRGITQLTALEKYGVMRLASRIADLRREGHPIITEMVEVTNRYGEKNHVAEYRLVK